MVNEMLHLKLNHFHTSVTSWQFEPQCLYAEVDYENCMTVSHLAALNILLQALMRN